MQNLVSETEAGAPGLLMPSILEVCESDFPLDALLEEEPAVLALITGVEGASYRPAGAAMVIKSDGTRIGNLSSGCLERDVALHARAALKDGRVRALRYGRGSPFVDITLPCGGGLDVALIPAPSRALLSAAQARLAARQPADLFLTPRGQLVAQPEIKGSTLHLRPQTRFVVFGKGPEATCFAKLTFNAGYPTELFSPDEETLDAAGFGTELRGRGWPKGVMLDPHTAVTLFFHDHEREPALLAHALDSTAFLVGAQGSLRAHQARCQALRDLGVPPERISRLASPFGLIPSTRDARTLAVSVLAQILNQVMTRQHGA